jgi:N-formylglutamate deformylase
MTEAGRGGPDTDWHVDRLYADILDDLGIPRIAAAFSRYVVDLNRPPDGAPLYPGAPETELCPTTTFDEAPIYAEGQKPGEAEIESRRRDYWQPYHLALAQLLLQAKDRYGIAVLWDAHSIRSHVPRFFDGRLPDLNLGSRGGTSCADGLLTRLTKVAREAGAETGISHVVDGRFKGGFITKSYGRPDENTHAIQLELSQATYMDEAPPWTFREDLADGIRPVLRRMLETAREWALAQAKG